MNMGASAEPTGLAGAEAPEPPSRLGPTDGIPSALRAVQAALDERKAIADFLVFRAVRAMCRHQQAPWWRPIERMQTKWAAAVLATTAQEVESLAHHADQARWIGDISGGGLKLCAAEGEDASAIEARRPETRSKAPLVSSAGLNEASPTPSPTRHQEGTEND